MSVHSAPVRARVSTTFLLMAQFDGRAFIPLEDLCGEYFPHLSPEKLWRKRHEIALPIVAIEDSQKAMKGVHIQDLADYLDARAAEAREDCRKLHGRIGA
jgi:hypothetical protein